MFLGDFLSIFLMYQTDGAQRQKQEHFFFPSPFVVVITELSTLVAD